MKANNIEVPRLRGCRWMKEEDVIDEEKIYQLIESAKAEVFEDAITSNPRFHPEHTKCYIWDWKTNMLRKKYLICDQDGNIEGIRWNLIHGKNKKRIKLALKHQAKAIRKSIETFNKYAGRDDILCVHARIGSSNWHYFDADKTVATNPAFLEKVDDWFDCTYCDIYFKLQNEKDDCMLQDKIRIGR